MDRVRFVRLRECVWGRKSEKKDDFDISLYRACRYHEQEQHTHECISRGLIFMIKGVGADEAGFDSICVFNPSHDNPLYVTPPFTDSHVCGWRHSVSPTRIQLELQACKTERPFLPCSLVYFVKNSFNNARPLFIT